ncbi:hypothetical protein ACFFJB_13805 [Camelimonas abortus]|uniref:Histidine kinase n=1 Tax=Camelimonas abortus TaxID=1017184 RepID=A0ABV7LB17_9HYPH
MPTLFRLVCAVAALGAVILAVMTALATLVTPVPREIVAPVRLPAHGSADAPVTARATANDLQHDARRHDAR